MRHEYITIHQIHLFDVELKLLRGNTLRIPCSNNSYDQLLVMAISRHGAVTSQSLTPKINQRINKFYRKASDINIANSMLCQC